MKAKIFSFFAGGGFLDLGFELEGFEVVFVNEYHRPFMDAYKHSRKSLNIAPPKYGYSEHSIEYYLTSNEGKKNLLSSVEKEKKSGLVGFIGGPPCPDFSVGGKNRGHQGENGRLSQVYVDIIKEQKPDFFLFENVKGLWKTQKHREFYENLKNQLSESGYILSDRLINALHYGAPQDRERIILMGISKDISLGEMVKFPWDDFMPYKNVSKSKEFWPQIEPFCEGISRIIPQNVNKELCIQYWFEKNRVTQHPNSRHYFIPRAAIDKFKVIPEGDDSKKSFKRLHRWRYSPTACYGNNEVHLHPYEARRISAAEALAIQSLPREFEFPTSMTLTDMFKCIGNGVPFMAARGLAKTIKFYLTKDIGDEEVNHRKLG